MDVKESFVVAAPAARPQPILPKPPFSTDDGNGGQIPNCNALKSVNVVQDFFHVDGSQNASYTYSKAITASGRQSLSKVPSEGWTQIPVCSIKDLGSATLQSNATMSPSQFVFSSGTGGLYQLSHSQHQMLLNGKMRINPPTTICDNSHPEQSSQNKVASCLTSADKLPIHLPNCVASIQPQITRNVDGSENTLIQFAPIAPYKCKRTKNREPTKVIDLEENRIKDSQPPEVIDLEDDRIAKRNKQEKDEDGKLTNGPVQRSFDQNNSDPVNTSFVRFSLQAGNQTQENAGLQFRKQTQENVDLQDMNQNQSKICSDSLAPVTPDKGKTLKASQPPEVDLLCHNETEVTGKQENGIVPTNIKCVNICSDTALRLSLGQETQKQNMEEICGVEQNKTPEQKPRRKKHRPKVIIEGKPPRKPKQMTPKSASTPENPSGKRKYVRKKALNSTSTPSSVNREAMKPSSSVQKSAKRALNFDSEEVLVNDGYKASNLVSNYETESELKARNGSSTSICGMHVLQGPGEVIDPLTRIASDRNSSTDPLQKENEACDNSISGLQPSKKLVVRENLKVLAREKDNVGTPSKADSSLYCNFEIHPPFTPEIRKNKRSKRDRGPRVDGAKLCNVNGNIISFDMRKNCTGIDNSNVFHCSTSQQVLFIPETCKKKRTKSATKEFISNAPSSLSLDSSRGGESLKNPHREVNLLADVQMILALDKLQAKEHILGHDHSDTKMKHPYMPPVQDFNSASQFTICFGHPSSTPKTPVPYDHRWVSPAMQTVVEDKLSKVPRRKRTKKEQAREASGMYSNSLHGSRVISSSYATRYSSFFSQTKVLHLVDFLIQKMKSLNINGHPEEVLTQNLQQENALVLYQGVGAIVPFETLLDLPKRRRPRPKVDLDSETNRVWMLLMGKNAIDGPDGTDIDKEKWWEEERKVFQGRADSFIARMHLVQGDRRFSQWKGSVVDSVVGVFLTQNVSDHLSSSAFMALAARFPARSREKNQEINTMQKYIPRPSQVVSIVEFADCIKKQEEIPTKHEASLGSTIRSEAQYVEEKEIEDMRSLDDTLSSQNSVVSSQNSSPTQANNQVGLTSESNSEVEDIITGNRSCRLDESTSFTKLLQLAGSNKFQELYSWRSGKFALKENPSDIMNEVKYSAVKIKSLVPDSHHCQAQHGDKEVSCAPSTRFSNCNCVVAVDTADAVGDNQHILPSNTSSFNNKSGTENSCTMGCYPTENETEITAHENSILISQIKTTCRSCRKISDHTNQSTKEAHSKGLSGGLNCMELTPNSASLHPCLAKSDGHMAELQQSQSQADYQLTNMQSSTHHVAQTPDQIVQQLHLKPSHCSITSDVSAFQCSGGPEEITPRETIASNANNENAHVEITNPEKSRRRRAEKKSMEAVDWDHLRRQTCNGLVKKERNEDTMDSIDWEAVRCADVSEISNTIRERGMNNMLAERIKDFLNRLVREHGSVDLEWLRDVPPDKTKDYLLSIRGLGLKSVECVRLLTLHHLAFPVDTNVGRICVRLGWVPLQPLPESLQLHLLELYPMLETIQKYLWPRLCKLDQRTLYELHYQMITFGKVFCTKSRPNCNACPMRGECKHFASAFASARLALPGPEEKSIVSSTIPVSGEQGPKPTINLMPLPQLEGNPVSEAEVHAKKNCEPIIEEPATPEPECLEAPESAIEDAFYEDPDEIPTIKLNIEKFTENLQNIMQENNMELQEGDISKALVALTPEAASIPRPKLKNINRLRTEHQVYELPDTHPLLEGLDPREPDDPCPYLLAIWTPGETAQSMESPKMSCSFQNRGMLCEKTTCFTCNSIREARAQKVRGTLLIPCRTAMRGSFPLNGTYFQVNEVFADHSSSLSPIDIPRGWIWNLPRRTVYFGTSIPTIFKGLTTEGIQHCFWRGFVCVRGFDQKTRAPRPLMARLHFPASKAPRNKKGSATKDE